MVRGRAGRRLGLPGEDEYSYDWYQGRYRIDLYQARTGHRIASVTVDGSRTPGGCPQSITVSPTTPRNDSDETQPDVADYAAQLSRLINGKSDS